MAAQWVREGDGATLWPLGPLLPKVWTVADTRLPRSNRWMEKRMQTMKLKSLAVAVMRVQVDELHAGHRFLLDSKKS